MDSEFEEELRGIRLRSVGSELEKRLELALKAEVEDVDLEFEAELRSVELGSPSKHLEEALGSVLSGSDEVEGGLAGMRPTRPSGHVESRLDLELSEDAEFEAMLASVKAAPLSPKMEGVIGAQIALRALGAAAEVHSVSGTEPVEPAVVETMPGWVRWRAFVWGGAAAAVAAAILTGTVEVRVAVPFSQKPASMAFEGRVGGETYAKSGVDGEGGESIFSQALQPPEAGLAAVQRSRATQASGPAGSWGDEREPGGFRYLPRDAVEAQRLMAVAAGGVGGDVAASDTALGEGRGVPGIAARWGAASQSSSLATNASSGSISGESAASARPSILEALTEGDFGKVLPEDVYARLATLASEPGVMASATPQTQTAKAGMALDAKQTVAVPDSLSAASAVASSHRMSVTNPSAASSLPVESGVGLLAAEGLSTTVAALSTPVGILGSDAHLAVVQDAVIPTVQPPQESRAKVHPTNSGTPGASSVVSMEVVRREIVFYEVSDQDARLSFIEKNGRTYAKVELHLFPEEVREVEVRGLSDLRQLAIEAGEKAGISTAKKGGTGD